MTIAPEVNDLVNKILLTILTGILGFVLPMAYKIFKAWAEAKIAKARAEVSAIADQEERAKAEAKLRLVEYSFTRLDHIVNNTVNQVAQEFTNQTSLTDAEKKERLQKAFARVKRQVPEDLRSNLETVVNDLDKYFVTKIEATRYKQKQEVKRLEVPEPPEC
jgi:hypothetical protein